MSNYTKTTDFEAKDSLPSGDNDKIIKGAEFETEFDAISTAIATKADTAGPTFTGTATFATTNATTVQIGGVAITSTAAELNTLDGITSTTAELNKLDGFTGTVDDLNYAKDLRASGVTAAEFDILDGLNATAAELNILDGATLSTAELNLLDGVTATTAELNYVDGVTSSIQTQIDTKSPTASPTFTGTVTIPTVDINAGTIDGTDVTVGTGKTLDVSSGTLTLANDQISGDKVEGGTIASTTITSLASTTVDTTNVEVTNIKAKDGTSAGSIADSTGVVTLASSVLTTTDINGGTIDGATIGGTTAAAGSFTTVSATGNITVDGTVDGRDVATDGTKLDGIEAGADVTDTTNVTAAGALMDSELTDITAVKSLDQGVATTDSPTFAGLTTTADVSFGDNDKAIFGAGSDLQIYHDGSNSYISDLGAGQLIVTTDGTQGIYLQKGATETLAAFKIDSSVDLYYDNSKKLATTSTGIDVTGTAVVDGLTSSAAITSTSNSNSFGGTTFTSAISGTTASMSGSITVSGNSNTIGGTTFSSNIDVTGTVTADGLTVDGDATIGGSSGGKLGIAGQGINAFATTTEPSIYRTGSGGSDIFSAAGHLVIQPRTSAARSVNIATSSDGVSTLKRASFADNGDISFYEDTGTTAKFFWDASNEGLGLGTTSPATGYRLDISGNSGYDDIMRITGVGTNIGPRINLTPTGTGTSRINATANSLQLQTGGTAAVTIDSSQNVGIGTSSPGQLLDVAGATAPTIRITNTDTDVAADQVLGALEFKGSDGSTDGSDVQAAIKAIYLDASPDTSLAFFTHENVGGQDDSITERMRITNNGNVGIGTSSPAQMLELSANNGVSGVANVLRFNDSDVGVTAAQPTGRIEFAENDGGNTTVSAFLEVETVGTSGGGEMTFGTGAAGVTATERMRIDSSGNLLVGQTSADSNSVGIGLLANGTAYAVRDGSAAILAHRKSSDGNIMEFLKDNTTVGSIGVGDGDNLYISGSAGSTKGLIFNDNSVIPAANGYNVSDNTTNLGSTSVRFKDLYLSGNAMADNFVGTDDTDTFIAMTGSNVMRFFTGNSERARIDSSGNLLVGASSFSFVGSSDCVQISGTEGRINIENDTASTAYAVAFYNTNGLVGRISTSASATAYVTSSDQRLKDNIVDAPSASDDIDAIQVRSFDWKADGSHQKYGMVAQELQSVAPEAVTGDADSDDMMGVDYSKLVPMLVKEIQSLRARVAQLEGEN